MSVKQYTHEGTTYIYGTKAADANHHRLTCPDEWDVCILSVRINKWSSESAAIVVCWVEDLMITPSNTSAVPLTGLVVKPGNNSYLSMPTDYAIGYRVSVMYEPSTNKIKIYNDSYYGNASTYVTLNSISAVWL